MARRNGSRLVQQSQGRPRPVVPRIDELAVGSAVTQPDDAPMPRPPYAAGSAEARLAGARGGRQRQGQARLARRLCLGTTFSEPRFEPYARAARAFRKCKVRELAATVGAGYCGPGPGSLIASASLQLAASRFAFEVLGDLTLGSRLADASRGNLLSAHQLCALETAAAKAAKNSNNGLPPPGPVRVFADDSEETPE